VAEGVDIAGHQRQGPLGGLGPSATTTIEAQRPRSWRRWITEHTSSMSKWISGTRAWWRRPRWRTSRDVAGVAAHDLDHHHPVVGLGRRVQPVDGVHAHLHRGVEAERELGGRQVVVDGLGHADHVHALGRQLGRHAQRVLAADGDQRVDPRVARVFFTASTPPSCL
jgi:hypothetical protein